MAVEASLPSFHKLFMKICKLVDRPKFDKLPTWQEKFSHIFKLSLGDEDIVETFKECFDKRAGVDKLQVCANQRFGKKMTLFIIFGKKMSLMEFFF